jgi:hypothetical protein
VAYSAQDRLLDRRLEATVLGESLHEVLEVLVLAPAASRKRVEVVRKRAVRLSDFMARFDRGGQGRGLWLPRRGNAACRCGFRPCRLSPSSRLRHRFSGFSTHGGQLRFNLLARSRIGRPGVCDDLLASPLGDSRIDFGRRKRPQGEVVLSPFDTANRLAHAEALQVPCVEGSETVLQLLGVEVADAEADSGGGVGEDGARHVRVLVPELT